jgi:hypothetical protein
MSIKKQHTALLIGVIAIVGLAVFMFTTSLPPVTPSETTPSSQSPNSSSAPTRDNAPLYITTMTHMEGSFPDDKVEKIFQSHVEDIRWAMELFDEYGAKLTIESEQPFAKANKTWDLNIMKEVVDSGHGVGTHADFGASLKEKLTLAELTERFKTNKKLVDDLVGAENNIGVSGGTGPTDWVLAASAAGFEYMDAVTGFGYLSMAQNKRESGWTDTFIRSTGYHDPIPPNFAERIYPLTLKDATDLVADENGIIAVMGGDLGELSSLAEGRNNCFPDCALNQSDIDEIEEAIIEADEIRDRSKFAKLNMHIPLALLTKENETILRTMLAMIQSYADDGVVVWGTQKEAYEAFVEWEKN